MSRWERLWYAPVAAVRPWLLTRVLLFVLAFDQWLLQLPHGGRYGAGGFNVAHVPLLDAVHPVPTSAMYVTLTLLTGSLSLWGALRPSRLVTGLVAVLFTWSWSMSLLDAWQHHYLLSLVLFGMALGPDVRAPEGSVNEGAWGFRLIPATLGLVYLFATISKLDPPWRAGQTLRAAMGPVLEPVVAWFGPELGWPLVAWGAISLEGLLAVGYLLAVGRDQAAGPRWDAIFGVSFAAVLVLHGTIEWIGLRIGWFTPYLLICGATFLLPERLLMAVAGPVSRLSRQGVGWLPDAAWVPVVGGGLGIVGLVSVGLGADLPGGAVAGLLTGASLALLLAREVSGGAGRAGAVACLLVLLALSTVLEQTEARFDFWRWTAGDLRRRGELEASLEAYLKAERYAPPGRSRAETIEELREELSSR